jgi:hypothetical protein
VVTGDRVIFKLLILLKINGQINEEGQWRVRKNAELQELYGEQDLVAFIKTGRLRWSGHVERTEDNRVPKRMLYGRPGGRRKKGRPRLRWLDEVEEDMREIGMRRWRTKE